MQTIIFNELLKYAVIQLITQYCHLQRSRKKAIGRRVVFNTRLAPGEMTDRYSNQQNACSHLCWVFSIEICST